MDHGDGEVLVFGTERQVPVSLVGVCGARIETSDGGCRMIDTEDGSARWVNAAVAEGSIVSCTMMCEALVTVKRCAFAGGELLGERKEMPGQLCDGRRPAEDWRRTDSIPYDTKSFLLRHSRCCSRPTSRRSACSLCRPLRDLAGLRCL